MIIVEVYYKAKPGMRDRIIELATPNIEASRKEQGNLSYAHFASIENDQEMLAFEKWESYEALDAHSKTAHHQSFSAARKPLLEPGSFHITIWDSQLNDERTVLSQNFANQELS